MHRGRKSEAPAATTPENFDADLDALRRRLSEATAAMDTQISGMDKSPLTAALRELDDAKKEAAPNVVTRRMSQARPAVILVSVLLLILFASLRMVLLNHNLDSRKGGVFKEAATEAVAVAPAMQNDAGHDESSVPPWHGAESTGQQDAPLSSRGKLEDMADDDGDEQEDIEEDIEETSVPDDDDMKQMEAEANAALDAAPAPAESADRKSVV